jgi:hypothetical protein
VAGVSTIKGDLRDLSPGDKSKRKKSSTNPKGSGRPKGSTKKDKPTSKPKLPWHRPRIVTVEQWGPFRAFVMLTLFDGRTMIVPQTPIVVNSTDAEAKARQREQWRLSSRASRARKKEKNPVTKRIDPVAFLKQPLPYSVLREIDAAAFKKLEGNPRDADGKPISFEQARVLALADIAKAAKKGK